MYFLRIILWPVSLLYGIGAYLYHWLYNMGILSSKTFSVPTISVGNITVGGTGKTPHVEYLIKMLVEEGVVSEGNLATLSRGYGRATSGFLFVENNATSFEVGDEPRQFKRKFSKLNVAVSEDRTYGIQMLMSKMPNMSAVLLDDAYQHRKIKPGFSVLLIDYHFFSKSQYLLPTGNLREPKSGIKRADAIVITNSPSLLSPIERRRILKNLNPSIDVKVYHSGVSYGETVPLFKTDEFKIHPKKFYFDNDYTVLLITGLANPTAIGDYYRQNFKKLIHLQFPDHHEYTMEDIKGIKKKFNNIVNQKKVVFTTEKDAMRFTVPGLIKSLSDLPIFYLPIRIVFNNEDAKMFNSEIKEYVAKNK